MIGVAPVSNAGLTNPQIMKGGLAILTVPEILEGGGLRVAFAWRGDRIGHQIEVSDRGRRVAVLESLEGSKLEDWPASPPLTELHRDERPDGKRRALLIGSAGQSHWSAGIELDAVAGRVRFDIACRACRQPAWLGSRYRLLWPTSPEALPVGALDGHQAAAILLGPACRLEAEAAEGACASVALEAGQVLSIRVPPVERPWPCTVRWRYAITIACGP